MKIHLVGHACIVAECADTSILMDPWLFGKIFNDSWTLLPEPKFDPAMLDKVDYIWISHEHPDHCHFPHPRLISGGLQSAGDYPFPGPRLHEDVRGVSQARL